MGLNSCYVILKYLVVLINFIFWLIGLGILALSIWLLTDPTVYIGATQNEQSYNSGIYVLLAVGVLIFIVGMLGCCGACKESQCLLVSFFSLLLIVIAAEIAAGVWAYTNKGELENLIKVNVRKTVEDEYGLIDSRTKTFDAIQRELHCCGAYGPHDWENSQYNKKKDKVDLSISSSLQVFEIPPSCCKGGEDNPACKGDGRRGLGTNDIPETIYSEGCISKLEEYIRSYLPWIIGIAIAIALLEVLALIFSFILCCAVRFVDRYKA